jgi:hypothetical protein
MMENRGKEITGGRFCAIVIGGQCADWEEVSKWSVSIPGNKPEVIKPVLPPVTLHIRRDGNVEDVKSILYCTYA